MDKMQLGLIALLKSGITGEAVPLPEGVSLEAVDRLVGKQGLLPLAFQGAQNCGISLEEPIMQRWWGRCYRNLIRSERQYRRMEELLAALGEKGLEHMPVKGCVLKKLYPRQELRPMSDADILIRQEQYPQVREVMESLGFRFVSENEHVWEWETEELHVELHKSLVPPGDGDYYGYYGTGWRFGIKGAGSRYDLSPMGRLIQEYTQLLAGDGLGSDKFWELEKRIRTDRKSVGVVADMRRSQMHSNLISLLVNEIIREEDLEGFSEELSETVKFVAERYRSLAE